MLNNGLWCVAIVCAIFFSTSCVNTHKATYFTDIAASEFDDVYTEPRIQKNDLLSISISSINPDEANIFAPTISVTDNSANNLPKGDATVPEYLVNRDGEIAIPLLGRVKANGLTRKELTDSITGLLRRKELLKDPIVNVRMLNFRITVLGEVAKPTVVNVPNEKITLLEALGLAGDLTIFGKRDNVLLIRVKDGKRYTHRINLNDKELFNSPYFYLETNDVLYVEPNKTKVATSTRSQQTIPIILSTLSLASIIANILIN